MVELEFIEALMEGATYDDLDNKGFSRSTCKRRLSALRDKGYNVKEQRLNSKGKKRFKLDVDSSEKLKKIMTSGDKRKAGEANREMYNQATEVLDKLYEDLEGYQKQPIDHEPESEVAALYVSDIHMGSVVQTDGERRYDTEKAREKISQLHDNSRKLTDYIDDLKEIDEFDFVFMGDIIENDIVYENQKYEIDKTPLEQVSEAVESFVPFVKDFAEEYEQVAIHTVPGNHGRMNVESHEESNWDNIFYHMLNLALKDEDNIYTDIKEGTWNEFYVKNKKIGITHGDNMHYQAGTSAGEKKFLRQIHQRELDELHLGHYHSRKSDEVQGVMIYWNGTPKPSGDFEDELGVNSVPTQTLITYSGERGTTGVHYIDCRDDEENPDRQL